jgi:hypothetical protein
MRATRELMAAALAVEDLATALGAATALLPYYHAVYPKVSHLNPAGPLLILNQTSTLGTA